MIPELSFDVAAGTAVGDLRVTLPAMRPEAVARVRELEARVLEAPQTEIETWHVLHAGMYARTIRIPAGVVLTGALIKRATLLVFNGHASVFIGDDEIELAGHHVIPASAGRKQAFIAHADTDLTMLFPTTATTVEQAEAEFTDEAERLMSRHGVNHVTITGEQP